MVRLCERFGCLPSQLYAEDADLLRLVSLSDLGRPRRRDDDEGLPGVLV